MTKTKKTRPASLDEALSRARSERGIQIGSLDEIVQQVEGYSTGNLALDYVTGCWGLPKGRIVELYGLQSSGKTTTALQAAAIAQQSGLNVVYLDYEASLDPVYCKLLGLDPYDRSFIVSQPDTFEAGMETLRLLVDSGEVAFAIIDSVAQMSTEKELNELDIGSQSAFGEKARMMAQTMRILSPRLAASGTTAVFLNHVRDVIDTSPMGQRLAKAGVERKTTPGGSALKFAASMRMHFKLVGKIRGDERDLFRGEDERLPVGDKVSVVVEKNKVGVPYRRAELRLTYGRGFSRGWSILQALCAHGTIKKKSGGVYAFSEDTSWEGQEQIRGEENVVEAIESTPEWFEHLSVLARRLLEEDVENKLISGDIPETVVEEDQELTELLEQPT